MSTERATDRPTPRPFSRRRWLIRTSAVVFTIIFGLIGLHIWWGHEADRRLNARIAEYRARGEPVLLENFQLDPIPDEQNAAAALQAAAAALPQAPEHHEIMHELCGDMRACKRFSGLADRLVAASEKSLQSLREARGRPECQWRVNLRSPAISTLLPWYGGQRRVARLANIAARQNYLHGNHHETIELVRDALDLADRLHHGQPFYITHVTRLALETLALRTIEDVASGLQVGTPQTEGRSSERSANRTQVIALIHILLDESSANAAFRFSVQGERMLLVDTLQWLCAAKQTPAVVARSGPVLPTPVSNLINLLASPAWKLDTVCGMDYYDEVMTAADAPNWPAARDQLPLAPEPPNDIVDWTARSFSQAVPLSGAWVVLPHYQSLARRRMAATALAIRLYELDHGIRPATLDDLVPEYLAQLPLDPFAAEDQSLGYLPHADSPRLYSVGEDGVDNDGAFEVSTYGRVDQHKLDLPFFLENDRPLEPFEPIIKILAPYAADETLFDDPLSQSGDDEKNEENAQRNK